MVIKSSRLEEYENIKEKIIKGYLGYKTITFVITNVSPEAQVKTFFYFVDKLYSVLKIFTFFYFSDLII